MTYQVYVFSYRTDFQISIIVIMINKTLIARCNFLPFLYSIRSSRVSFLRMSLISGILNVFLWRPEDTSEGSQLCPDSHPVIPTKVGIQSYHLQILDKYTIISKTEIKITSIINENNSCILNQKGLEKSAD